MNRAKKGEPIDIRDPNPIPNHKPKPNANSNIISSSGTCR